MAEPAPKPWTVEEFLAWERQQDDRFEYVGGMVRMMTGGTNNHSVIVLNLAVALRAILRGTRCTALAEGPKVRTAHSVMYPDVLVTCAPLDLDQDTVAEPLLIAEVLSKSTAGFDRGIKWDAYQYLPSLRHYLLIEQEACKVDLFTRDGDGWRLTTYKSLEQSVPLAALDMELPLEAIYAGSMVRSA